MKSLFHRLKRFALFLLGIIIAIGSIRAAAPAGVTQAQAVEDAFEFSQALILAGDLQQGQKVLLDANQSLRGTLAWHMESAGSLVRMAYAVRHAGKIEAAVVLGRSALHELALAEKKLGPAADAKLAAAIQTFAGEINENLAGTTEIAKGHYRAAVQLDPEAVTARAKVKWMEEQEHAAKERAKKAGGK